MTLAPSHHLYAHFVLVIWSPTNGSSHKMRWKPGWKESWVEESLGGGKPGLDEFKHHLLQQRNSWQGHV